MLALILEHLLSTLAAPFLAAIPAKNKKSSKKVAKPKTKTVSGRSSKKTAKPKVKPVAAAKSKARPVEERPSRSGPKDKSSKVSAREPAPPAPPVVTKPVEREPIVKPVPPVGRAILLSPENEKFSDNLTPTFRWLSVGGATRYEVAWSEEPNLSPAHSVVSTRTEAAVPVDKPLRLGATYFWRVRGGNEGGWGPWSSIISFRVLDEAAS